MADIADGMRWAAGLPVAGVPLNANKARVVNVSFGGTAPCGNTYQSAVNDLMAAGVVVISAAGNEHTSPTRPASCVGVVGVAALNRDGFKTHYSNFGSALSSTGIATVAGDDAETMIPPIPRWNALADDGLLTIGLLGTASAPGNPVFNYGYFGTSFSTPIVTGAVGLMLGVNPNLSYAQIIEGLRKSARPHVVSSYIGQCSDANPGRCLCTTSTCGVGILDAEQAVLYAANPAAYVPPARSAAQLNNADVIAASQLGPDRDPNPASTPQPDSGGGGAMSWLWLCALALCALALPSARGRLRRR